MEIGVVDIANANIFGNPMIQEIQTEILKSVETCSPSKSLEHTLGTERIEKSTVEGSIKGYDDNLTKNSYAKLKKPSS